MDFDDLLRRGGLLALTILGVLLGLTFCEVDAREYEWLWGYKSAPWPCVERSVYSGAKYKVGLQMVRRWVLDEAEETTRPLIVTWEGEPYRVLDVSEWEPGKDAVAFYPRRIKKGEDIRGVEHYWDEYRSWEVYIYLWQGEESINFNLKDELLWVNGKIVGGMRGALELIHDPINEKTDSEDLLNKVYSKYLDVIDFNEIVTITSCFVSPGFRLGPTPPLLREFPNLKSAFLYLERTVYAYADYHYDPSDRRIHYRDRSPLSKRIYFDKIQNLSDHIDVYLYIEDVTDDELGLLAKSTNLKGLWIVSDSVTDAGLMHLEGLSSLRYLWIESEGISDSGLKYLAGLSDLLDLNIESRKITHSEAARLQQALPGCDIMRRDR